MRTIRTVGLPEGGTAEQIYTFYLKDPNPQIVLEIPGNWGGPDTCTPEFPEQEQWLNSLALRIRQSWDCQWTFEDEEAVGQFLDLLAPFAEGPTA
jgi:hypothetical protein